MQFAVIADIHSNLEALEAVLKKIERDGIKTIICAGDIIGYGPNPNEAVELVRKRCFAAVCGNHDANIDLHNLGWFEPSAAHALEWTKKTLTKENFEYLLGLDHSWKGHIGGKSVFIVHGSPRDYIYDYVYPDIADTKAREWLRNTASQVLVVAHLHIPFIRKMGARAILNPGSVGQPRDGDRRASYAIVNTKQPFITIRRVEYDIGKTAEKIREAGLPQSLADRLSEGL